MRQGFTQKRVQVETAGDDFRHGRRRRRREIEYGDGDQAALRIGVVRVPHFRHSHLPFRWAQYIMSRAPAGLRPSFSSRLAIVRLAFPFCLVLFPLFIAPGFFRVSGRWVGNFRNQIVAHEGHELQTFEADTAAATGAGTA